jgi:peptidoglycan/LPS O-acetylase OafA/YrhL
MKMKVDDSIGLPMSDQQRSIAAASPYVKHIPALDGVRGIAVIAVMFSHLFPGTARGTVQHVVGEVLQFGATGVDLFFVLSGFLITGILFDSLEDDGYFRKFYARRMLRIFPLYYGVLACCGLWMIVNESGQYRELLSYALYLQNTRLLVDTSSANARVVLPIVHFWSLAIEEQFYLVWPLLIFVIRKQQVLLAICLGAVVICPILRALCMMYGPSPYFWIHANTLLRADSLLAGGALALMIRSNWQAAALRWAWLIFLLVSPLVLLVRIQQVSEMGSVLQVSLGYTVVIFWYGALLLLSIRGGVLQRFFSAPTLRWVGKYSYGFYVYHLILYFQFQPSCTGSWKRMSQAIKVWPLCLAGYRRVC